MRRIFTAEDSGLTRSTLRWGERERRWVRAERGIYLEGGDAPSELDFARARVLAARSVARGTLSGALHELDSVTFNGQCTRNQLLLPSQVVMVDGVPCADGFTTLVDIAPLLNDTTWEHALESALRKQLTSIRAIELALPELSRSRTPGTPRIRQVLALRPPGAPPTGSLLETLMVQLAREIPGLAAPVRQFVVYDEHGEFVAQVDLCWPQLGLFIELDGQHHKGQPVHDARRETAVVAATGWLVGRFTWYEVVHIPHLTARRLAGLVDQARRRPLPQSA